jgi:hypothetical protein
MLTDSDPPAIQRKSRGPFYRHLRPFPGRALPSLKLPPLRGISPGAIGFSTVCRAFHSRFVVAAAASGLRCRWFRGSKCLRSYLSAFQTANRLLRFCSRTVFCRGSAQAADIARPGTPGPPAAVAMFARRSPPSSSLPNQNEQSPVQRGLG